MKGGKMKKIIFPLCLILLIVSYGLSFAQNAIPIPITAEEAFDAVQSQKDPISGEETSVALIDVRSRAEFYWVGAACQVVEIITSNEETIVPDYGKVRLSQNGKFLSYKIDGNNEQLQTRKVSKLNLTPISINIPFELWNEDTGTLTENPNFVSDIEALGDTYGVLIFFCRSGGRSQACLAPFDTSLFDSIYEIDQPDGESGYGGFEGNSYSNVYNGYRGFPERLTETQEHSSVSWKDAGLPIKTSVNPLAQ